MKAIVPVVCVMAPAPVVDTAVAVYVLSTTGVQVLTACVSGVYTPYNVAYKFLLTTDCNLSHSLLYSCLNDWHLTFGKITCFVAEIFCQAGFCNLCTSSGYQLLSGVPASILHLYSLNCCNTLLVYSVKAALEPEEMVIF